jgi:hypothetical protein
LVPFAGEIGYSETGALFCFPGTHFDVFMLFLCWYERGGRDGEREVMRNEMNVRGHEVQWRLVVEWMN